MADLKPQTLELQTRDEVVLQYLGAALVLQWPHIPEMVRRAILQQASAVGGLPPVAALQEQIGALLDRKKDGPSPSDDAREIYASPNGDRWWLVRDDQHGLCVRHEANPASGAHVATMDVASFLAVGGHGPEKDALLQMIGAGLESSP